MTIQTRIQSTLQITDTDGNVEYITPSRIGTITGTIVTTAPNGPTPGAILVDQDGVDIDLSELSAPGLCEIYNMESDETKYISYGLRAMGNFFYLGEVLPGENFVLRLSRLLGIESGTGTGTGAVASGIALRLRSHTSGTCRVRVNAFDK